MSVPFVAPFLPPLFPGFEKPQLLEKPLALPHSVADALLHDSI